MSRTNVNDSFHLALLAFCFSALSILMKALWSKRFLLATLLVTCSFGLAGCGKTEVCEATSTELLNEQQQTAQLQTEQLQTEPVPTVSTEEEPAKLPPSQLTLLMTGDILLHTPVAQSGQTEDGSYCFDFLFSHTRDMIQEADIALVNQEVIIGGEELGVSGYPCFNAPYSLGDALADAGFDVICHATNHALDKGKKGLLNCFSYWQDTHPSIQVLGIHDSAESQNTICYIEENDITVAFLNYTYGTNGIPLPEGMPYAVDLLEKEKVISDIREAEANADFTVVCPHWGTEYQLTHSSYQQEWTKLFLDNGVDLVLGTHPHVIESVEMLTNEATGENMLVYYSLGNFLNWTSGTGEGVARRMLGGVAGVTLQKEESGDVYIADYGITAVVCHVSEGAEGVTVYPLSEYSSALADTSAILAQDPSFSRDYCVDLCNQVWGDLWD